MNDASNSRQQMILQRSLAAAEVAARLGLPAASARADVEARRVAGHLFVVWDKARGEFVYPDFQFDPGVTEGLLRHLLEILASRFGFDPATEDRGEWGRAFWLYRPNSCLSLQSRTVYANAFGDSVAAASQAHRISDIARTPAETFATDPHGAIELASRLADRSARGTLAPAVDHAPDT